MVDAFLLVITSVPQEALSVQEMVCGDNNRTPVISGCLITLFSLEIYLQDGIQLCLIQIARIQHRRRR